MANPSPRKTVPLSAPHDPNIPNRTSMSHENTLCTRRAFFGAVVVEENAGGLSQDVQELISSLGVRVSEHEDTERSNSAPMVANVPDLARSTITRKRALTEGTSLHASIAGASLHASHSSEDGTGPRLKPSRLGHKRTLTETDTLQDMIREVVTTERTYVKRLQILKQDYADPLRNFSKRKEEALLDKYKAKTLFGNVDQLLSAHEEFLNDLEKMLGPNGTRLVGGIGDVALKHFRDKRAFDCYKLYYAKREEAQAIFEEEVAKGGKAGFAAYIERIKYSSSDVRNRIGLRELLAEPIQRMPRYTMMWQNILKQMDHAHPQRPKLLEAERIASKIASCESDDPTKRAFIMHCLERTIEGFPPGLFSNGRTFVDCIDVEDIPVETPQSSSASTNSGLVGVLYCTLFLFDDRLIIVKRPNGTSSGRSLAKLDDIPKLLRTNGLASLKKSGMSCKGSISVLDLTATDPGGSEMHMYLEEPPSDQSDRWRGRPFRNYSIVLPPAPVGLDLAATQEKKKTFLENLWKVQVLARVKEGRCIALKGEEVQIENRGVRANKVGCWWNLYLRTPYLGESKRHKIVVHIDPTRVADSIPFGIVGGPFVVIRLQPIPGGLCRYNVTCNSPDEGEEEDIVRMEAVPARLAQTIHQFGLFSFKTGAVSRPNTPTASTRSRAAVFGLDVISRTLISSNSKLGGEMFSFGTGTISGTKRSKGAMSRSSIQTMSTESTRGSSYRSGSTAATSLLGAEEEGMVGKNPKKLVMRGKSPGAGSGTESEPRRSIDTGKEPSTDADDEEEEVEEILQTKETRIINESERDLAMRLEIAKRNSMSLQAVGSDSASFLLREPPFSETIYEEDPPPSKVTPERRPARYSGDEVQSDPMTSTRLTPAKPLPQLPRKPTGPRRSLVPPRPSAGYSESNSLTPPRLSDPHNGSPHSFTLENAFDKTLAAFSPPRALGSISDEDTPTKPLILDEQIAQVVTETPTGSSSASVEPLSIKKKSNTKPRRSLGSFRRIHAPEPPSPTPENKLKYTSSMVRSPPKVPSGTKGKEVERIVIVAKTTKEDLSSARRAVKRIKKEVEVLKDDVIKDMTASRLDRSGAISPTQMTSRSIVRSPPNRQINKAAEARMEEMRQMIERRGASTTATVTRTPNIAVPVPSSVLDSGRLEQWTRLVESLVEDADRQIMRAMDQNEALVQGMASLNVEDDASSKGETEKLRVELQSSKRQTDVLKQLLQDATAENEALYSAFNQELDAMYEDVQLPEDQAWKAMVEKLQCAKTTRNQLAKENFQYKQKLQLAEQRNEELLALLKAHGLEPPKH